MNHSQAESFDPVYRPEAMTVPEIGAGVGVIDRQNEKYLGEKIYREINKHLVVVQDPWLEDQLNQIFTRITSQTNLGQPLGLLLINDKQVNAFAVPGGVFALNTGLLKLAKNTDEVASVMSHEIAHVTQRHYSRSQEAFKGQGLLALAGILVGAAIATQSDGQAGSAVMLGTQAALLDKQLSYSRNQEREADRIGMQYMVAAGFNPNSMADFFERMQRSTTQLSFMPEFWLTHPLTTQRMSEARLRARQYPQVKPNLLDSNYDIIRWYAMVLSNDTSEQELVTLAPQNQAVKLALTAFYNRQGDYQKALSILNSATAEMQQLPLAILIKTDSYIGLKQYDQAYHTIIKPQQIMPENRAYSYKLAQVLIRQQKYSQAQELVKRILKDRPRDIGGWDLMVQAASLDQKSEIQAINVLRYRAEVQFWSGGEEAGIKSLLHAQRLAKNNNSLSGTIEIRLKQMQQERLYNLS
ncbi:MAG: M48 family metalloprotease [Acinetobacter sp.]